MPNSRLDPGGFSVARRHLSNDEVFGGPSQPPNHMSIKLRGMLCHMKWRVVICHHGPLGSL
jgi:hypothetical protein